MRDAAEIEGEPSWLEVAGWSGAALDRILERSDLPVPRERAEAKSAAGIQTLRIAPRVAWVIAPGGTVPGVQTGEDGAAVDLSSSRLRIAVASAVLARLVAVDLAAVTSFAASQIHGVPVIMVRTGDGFDLLVPRSLHTTLSEWIEAAPGV